MADAQADVVLGTSVVTRTRNAQTCCREAILVIGGVREGDTVATEELQFGENDTLSAMVAALTNADLLILISDVDAVYTSDPRRDAEARRLSVIDEITPLIVAAAGGDRKSTRLNSSHH